MIDKKKLQESLAVYLDKQKKEVKLFKQWDDASDNVGLSLNELKNIIGEDNKHKKVLVELKGKKYIIENGKPELLEDI